jgi:hypothetical protein
MRLHSGARPEPLVLKFAGQVPTLPHPLNLKVDANGWRNTDLADTHDVVEADMNNSERIIITLNP